MSNAHSSKEDLKSFIPFPSDVVPSGKIIKFSDYKKPRIKELIIAQGNYFIEFAIRNYIYMKNFEGKFSNKSFKFIKVGANDGLKTDPFGKLILNCKNWTGALIEPVPYLFDKLNKNYSSKRFSLHQLAISNHNRSTILYSLDTDQFKNDNEDSKFYEDWMDGISFSSY